MRAKLSSPSFRGSAPSGRPAPTYSSMTRRAAATAAACRHTCRSSGLSPSRVAMTAASSCSTWSQAISQAVRSGSHLTAADKDRKQLLIEERLTRPQGRRPPHPDRQRRRTRSGTFSAALLPAKRPVEMIVSSILTAPDGTHPAHPARQTSETVLSVRTASLTARTARVTLAAVAAEESCSDSWMNAVAPRRLPT